MGGIESWRVNGLALLNTGVLLVDLKRREGARYIVDAGVVPSSGVVRSTVATHLCPPFASWGAPWRRPADWTTGVLPALLILHCEV